MNFDFAAISSTDNDFHWKKVLRTFSLIAVIAAVSLFGMMRTAPARGWGVAKSKKKAAPSQLELSSHRHQSRTPV